ncbi:MAG: phenylalanine--tRNA ligase subunit alpha [Legionellales bacterium]|nr:phenylalanine--tRNA ligase subunit alpha [Legionellales bacterium]
MKQEIEQLQASAFTAIEAVNDLIALQAIRVDFLGKKGRLTELLKQVVNLSAAEKPLIGQVVNQVKRDINDHIEAKLTTLKDRILQTKLQAEKIDVTLNGRACELGSRHPVAQIKQRINEYFSRLGFDIVDGPEIETDFYNFTALNIPAHHPARAMHDTFYFGDGSLLRTHTSSVQIRTMEQRKPPLRLIAPGRVYRYESDLTHTPMFHQVEGLLIDTHASLADLKGVLHQFFSELFGRELRVRFRPSYFPFTEPSAEMDIECTQCAGSGCRTCKFSGWIEVGGCGMVHPNVLQAVNISPETYQGWAFGMGIDRITMLYYTIDDLRLMFENDVTFLNQF